jgi:brefeldin A-inhibited guanine nucleotide-exchange protein
MQGNPNDGSDTGSDDGGNRQKDTITMENDQSSIWIQAVRHLIDIYTQFFLPRNQTNETECFLSNIDLIKELLDLIVLLAGRNSQNLAQTGIIYLNEFVRKNAVNFDETVWEAVVSSVEKITAVTIPVELFRLPTRSSQKRNKPLTDVAVEEESRIIASIDLQHAILKCAIHLFLLEFIRDFAIEQDDFALYILRNTAQKKEGTISQYPSQLFRSLSIAHRSRILSCLHASFSFAFAFNSNYDLRQALYNLKVVEKMPSLVRQEAQSISSYITVLFHLYRYFGDETDDYTQIGDTLDLLAPSNLAFKRTHPVLQTLVAESIAILERYIRFLSDPHRYSHDLNSWAMVILLIFKEILAIPWSLEIATSEEMSDYAIANPTYAKSILRVKDILPNRSP